MTNAASLKTIAEGILESEYARQTLSSDDEIVNYAESAGADIDYEAARRIQEACLPLLSRIESGEIPTTHERFVSLEALSD